MVRERSRFGLPDPDGEQELPSPGDAGRVAEAVGRSVSPRGTRAVPRKSGSRDSSGRMRRKIRTHSAA
eukprot:12417377-Heterocapsa_arctica.AAC.1